MSWSATSTNKCCATCVNWGGERKLRPGNSAVETESPGVRGACYERKLMTTLPGPCAYNQCPNYKKWSALR